METEEELRQQAIRQLKRKQEFWRQLFTYGVVNAFLIGIWYFVSGRGYFWPGWVLLGWGIGLAIFAWDVFGRRGITEDDVKREMDRQRVSGAIYDADEKD